MKGKRPYSKGSCRKVKKSRRRIRKNSTSTERLRERLKRPRPGYEYNVQGYYSGQWEDVDAHDNRYDAIQSRKNYDENERQYPHRVIVRRIKANRRRSLRRNPEKLKPRMIGDMEMRLIKLLAKKRGWTKYSAKRQSYNPYDIVIDGEGPGTRQFAGDLKLIAIRELLNWTSPEIAKMSDYPYMVREGDWSGIRDSSDQAIDKIFEIFVLRRYG